MTSDLTDSRNNQENLWQPNRKKSQQVELAVKILFASFALVSILTTVGIVFTLIFETIEFFKEVSLWNFLTDSEWRPDDSFGIFALISGTVLTSTIAIMVALPLGLLAAICLSEYASPQVRKWLKPALELLAGVPSVVFGYFALLFVTPFLRSFVPGLEIFNALSAGLVLGVAITPLVASLSEDAIYSVPTSLRQGSYALGATKRETITSVVLPAALSGIVASAILAISRAVGETMIVTLAAGQQPSIGFNPLTQVQTMTAFIVAVTTGEAPAGSLKFKTLFAVGMTLFLMTLALNVFSFWFVRRFREKYD
ncbi:MAG: phosphate ABC transporter permease subunit PstC [Spirulinaceae cyanobacterium]